MTLNDLELSKKGVLMLFSNFWLWHTF